jgi:hypothetical protein
MAPWRHGRIYLGGRWHEPSAGPLKLPAGDNSAYLARWAAALAHDQVRCRKTKRGIKISRRGVQGMTALRAICGHSQIHRYGTSQVRFGPTSFSTISTHTEGQPLARQWYVVPFRPSPLSSIGRSIGVVVVRQAPSRPQPASRIFQAAMWYSALETNVAAATLSWKMWYSCIAGSAFDLDWQRKCPRPIVQGKPVTQPDDGGEGATPYCWSWRLDFLFLAPQRAHCIMRCSR